MNEPKPLSSEIFRDEWGVAMRNPIEFREWFKILFRLWRPRLSPNQFLVALFIFDRTAAWGKEWEVITNRQFLTGVTGKDGKEYAGGLVMSEPTLIACVHFLIEAGAVRCRKVKRRKAYALNYEWNPEQCEAMGLKTPKRLQNVQIEAAKTKETLVTKTKETLACNTRKENCYAKAKGNATHSPAAELPGLLDHAEGKAKQARNRKIAKWSTASALTAWMQLHRESPLDAIPLATTKTDGVILHRYGARWIKADRKRSTEDWLAFLGWVICRWPLLRTELFGWMKTSSPAVPSIRFLVRFSDKFETAYADAAKFDALSGMDARSREIHRLMARGMEREVAERDVDARLGLTREKEAAEKATRELKRQRLLAEADVAARQEASIRNERWSKRAKDRKVYQDDSGLATSGESLDDWR